jgi:hypothetical protein
LGVACLLACSMSTFYPFDFLVGAVYDYMIIGGRGDAFAKVCLKAALIRYKWPGCIINKELVLIDRQHIEYLSGKMKQTSAMKV